MHLKLDKSYIRDKKNKIKILHGSIEQLLEENQNCWPTTFFEEDCQT